MTVTEPAQPTTAPPGAPMAHDHIDIDLSTGACFESGVPHDAFDALRAAAPVAWHPETLRHEWAHEGSGLAEGPGFWVVTNHAGVNEVSRNPQRFSSWLGCTMLHTFDPDTLTMYRQMMLNMDAPEHTRLRRILQPIFTPRAIERLHAAIHRSVGEILDEIPEGETFDFVTTVAAELPVRVIADLLGMPYEDRRLTYEWSNTLVGFDDPDFGGDPELIMTTVAQIFEYGQRIADERRAEPRDDIISLIANAEVDGEKLSDVEFSMFWLLLIVAGNETTRNAISASVLALHEHDRWGWLGEHPESMAVAVDELVRYVSPVIHFRRTAVADTELESQRIRAGDKVVVWYPAANHDPAVFDRPHELILDRTPNPHLAFGIGPHFCLGSHLAKLEMSAMIGALVERYPTVSVSDGVGRVRSNFVAGIKTLPVRFD